VANRGYAKADPTQAIAFQSVRLPFGALLKGELRPWGKNRLRQAGSPTRQASARRFRIWWIYETEEILMKLKSTVAVTCVLLGFGLLAVLPAWAAVDRGAIQGTVTDAQGAVVPNVAVEVTNTDTNITAATRTNDAGFFAAIELVPGNNYTVRFRVPGFKVIERTKVEVKAGTRMILDVSLQVGDVAETINIEAESPLLETTASNFSTGVQQQLLQQVPIVGRDIQTLVQILPGVTQSIGPSGSVFGFDSQFGGFPDPTHIVGSGISANGSQGGANAWYLDGTLNATLGPESVVVNPSPDAVSEFNVVNNGLAAEWGRTSGLIANVVLKSGTNSIHGNLYEFNRNSYFSANNPFQRRDAQGNAFLSPAVNFNDFGGTIGGPIRKNKTFFFTSWGTSFLHVKKPRIYTVPTAKNRAGDFTDRPDLAQTCDPAGGVFNCLYDPYATTGPDADGLFHRTPFTAPVIPQDRIDPLAKFYADSFPTPNFLDPLQQGSDGCGALCNNFLSTVGSGQTTHNMSVKVDHQFTENSKLFAEYLLNPSYYKNFKLAWTGPTAETNGIAGAQPYRTMNQIFTLGHTYTFGGTWVNEARASFSRQNQRAEQNPDELVGNDEIKQRIQGLNFVLDEFGPVPTIGVGGFNGFGPQQWQNAIQGVDAFTVLDNVSKIIGKHSLKTGLMWRRDRNWNLASWGYNLNFGGGLTNDPVSGLGGNGLAQFLLGAVDTGSGAGTYHAPYQSNDYWGMYIQDDYRISPNFTLNVGLRWDIFGWFRERSDALANFDFNAENPKVPYKGRIVYFGTPAHPDRNVFPAHKNSLGPRLAFAWTPFSDKKTVIRGGYGLIYSNGLSVAFGTQNGAISAPAYANYFGYNGDFTGARPAFQFSQGAPDLGIPPIDQVKKDDNQFLTTGTGAFLNGSRDPYVQQWSLYVERELPSNMVLSVGYVGTHGLHLYGDEFRGYNYVPTKTRQQLRNQINQQLPTPEALIPLYGETMPASRLNTPYPQYGGVGVNSNPDGFNRYHSLQTRLEKRFSQGLSFTAVYTFQKNIGTPNTGSLIGNSATPTTLGRTVGRSAYVPGALSGGVANCASGTCGSFQGDPDNRFQDVALTADDIPHIFNAAVLYELPFGKGKPFLSSSGAANAILGGWRLTQNWNVQTGVPLPIFAPCNELSCRPNLIGDPRFSGSRSRAEEENQWFNPAAFEAPFGSNPAIFNAADPSIYDEWWRFGNMGWRNSAVRSPGYWNVDISLSKDFHLSDTRYFSFRWEIYNALNHQNLGIPDINWCLPPLPDGSVDQIHVFGCQFGKITNVQTDPRAMQFGLKFYW
jgi:hypothetical protein